MKRVKTVQIIAGALIPSVLLQSCSGYFIDEDVIVINEEMIGTKTFNSSVVQLDFKSTTEEKALVNFISELINDIISNPAIANELTRNPTHIAKMYGVEQLNINFDDKIWTLIAALGDSDLQDAMERNDVTSFLDLCSERGLISDLRKSDIVRYQRIAIPESEVRPMCAAYVFFGVAAILLLTAAGCVGVAAAGIYISETYWSGSETTQSTMAKRDPLAYQLWVLKKGKENTRIVLSEYQERRVNECLDALNQYFPEKMENVDIEELRLFISLNLPE